MKNLLRFPLNFNDLNLKFNNFRFETNKIPETTVIRKRILQSSIIFEKTLPSAEIIDNEYMSTVFAGVAKPLKYLEEDFLVLKRANLQAEHKVIKNPVNGTNEDDIDPTEDEGAALNILYNNIPGTKPKLTKSAKESN